MFAILAFLIAVFSESFSNAHPSDPNTCYDSSNEDSVRIQTISCERCFQNENPTCRGKTVQHRIIRSFTPTIEMGNWPSSELVASVFRILAEEVLGFGVRPIVRSDYLNPYKRVSNGNVSIALETWDQQMIEDKIFYTDEANSVVSSKLGMTGVEGIYIPGYVDAGKLPFGNSYYSFMNVQELETLSGPFIRAGTTSCVHFDVKIVEGYEPFCDVKDFDCETLTYHGKVIEFAYNGFCVAKGCDPALEDCRLNGYWALVPSMARCFSECEGNSHCIGYSYRENAHNNNGLCTIHANTIKENSNGWQAMPHGHYEIEFHRTGSGDNSTTCWVKVPNTKCNADAFDFPCSRHGPSWNGGTNCTHQDQSMWCPPDCVEDPTECLEVMMVTPAWAPGWFESLSKTLRIPVCFVYYGWSSFQVTFRERYNRNQNFFFWWYTPTKLLLEYEHTMVDFPDYNGHCGRQDKKDPMLSRIYCSFEDQVLGKIIEKRIADVANSVLYPHSDIEMDYYDLHTLWDNFHLEDEDYSWLLTRHDPMQHTNTTSSVACEYVRTHVDKWCLWLQDTSAFDYAPYPWKLSKNWFWILTIITIVTLGKAVITCIFVYHNRENTLIKSASYKLSMIIIFGAIMVVCSALFTLLSFKSSAWCVINQWFFHVGNAFVYCSLFFKIYRLHLIFDRSMRPNTPFDFDIKDQSIIRYITVWIILINIYFCVYSSTHDTSMVIDWRQQEWANVCWKRAPPMILFLHFIDTLGFVCILVAAFRARNSPSGYNESPIILSLVSFTIVPRVVLSSFYLADLDQSFTMRAVCQCLNEVLSGGVVVWFLFAHRIKLLYFSPKDLQLQHVNASMNSRMTFTDGNANSDDSDFYRASSQFSRHSSRLNTSKYQDGERPYAASITLSMSGNLHATSIMDHSNEPIITMQHELTPEAENHTHSTTAPYTRRHRQSVLVTHAESEPPSTRPSKRDPKSDNDIDSISERSEIELASRNSMSLSGGSTSARNESHLFCVPRFLSSYDNLDDYSHNMTQLNSGHTSIPSSKRGSLESVPFGSRLSRPSRKFSKSISPISFPMSRSGDHRSSNPISSTTSAKSSINSSAAVKGNRPSPVRLSDSTSHHYDLYCDFQNPKDYLKFVTFE